MALIIWSWQYAKGITPKKFWFEIALLSKKCKKFFRGNAIAMLPTKSRQNCQDQMIWANLFFYNVYKMRNNALSVN